MIGVDYIFHSAALKQVHPVNFINGGGKTNRNRECSEAAIQNRVKRVVCLSTDKAVYQLMLWEFLKH